MRTTELLSVCRFTAGTPSAITVAEALIGLRVWVCEFIDAGLILMPIAGALSGAPAVAVASIGGGVLHGNQAKFLPHGVCIG